MLCARPFGYVRNSIGINSNGRYFARTEVAACCSGASPVSAKHNRGQRVVMAIDTEGERITRAAESTGMELSLVDA